MKLPTRLEKGKEVHNTDEWVGKWVWHGTLPCRIDHVETVTTKTPDPAGGDDIETTTQWARIAWRTWEVCWRTESDRVPHTELEAMPEASDDQVAALEGYLRLLALGRVVGGILSAGPAAAGAGVTLDPDTLARVEALTADLDYAMKRRRVGM